MTIISTLTALFLLTTLFPTGAQPEAPVLTLSEGDSFVVEGLSFVQSVSSLNPFSAYEQSQHMVIWPCFSTLLTYDSQGVLIGDVADSWTMSPDGLNWSFRIQQGIYFCDPLNPMAMTHEMTWVDIEYSYFQVQNHSNRLQSHFMCGESKVLNRIWGSVATHWVNISLNMPFAALERALTDVPIIPKYYWQPHEKQGDATRWPGYDSDGGYTNVPLVGSGPWYCEMTEAVLHGATAPTELTLRRNPTWFQEANRGWHIGIGTLTYRNGLTPQQEWTDLELGKIDLAMDVPHSVFLNELPAHPSVIAWAQDTGWFYEYNLNQMTTAMRKDLGPRYTGGTNSQLLQDPVIKRAMAMAVDRQSFADQVVDGLGSPADSIVPELSPWHYDPPNLVAYDIEGARTLLESNGYQDIDADGVRECTQVSPAVQNGLAQTGAELAFRFITPNLTADFSHWYSNYPQGAALIRDWTAQIGIKLNLEPKSWGTMSSVYWFRADYDAWLWSWEFYPNSEPCLDIMGPWFTTDMIGPWQDLYWSNETFDSTYNESLVAIDPAQRRVLIDQMQQMAYDNMGCQPVIYVQEIYAANLTRWARPSFDGCGVSWTMSPDSSLPWLYMQLTPAAPIELVPLAAASGVVGQMIWFNATAYNPGGQTLVYTWDFGDGYYPQQGNPIPHTYYKTGNFAVTVSVNDGTGLPGHNVSSSAVVSIGFELMLKPGWNLIGIPLNRTILASDLDLEFGEIVVGWNCTIQSYDRTYIAGFSPPSMDFVLVKGLGYWIYSNSQKSLILYGPPLTGPQTVELDVPSTGGWAIISLPFRGIGWGQVSQLMSKIIVQGPEFGLIVRWNADTQTYQVHIIGLPINNFLIVAGEGYWIQLPGDARITYS